MLSYCCHNLCHSVPMSAKCSADLMSYATMTCLTDWSETHGSFCILVLHFFATPPHLSPILALWSHSPRQGACTSPRFGTPSHPARTERRHDTTRPDRTAPVRSSSGHWADSRKRRPPALSLAKWPPFLSLPGQVEEGQVDSDCTKRQESLLGQYFGQFWD